MNGCCEKNRLKQQVRPLLQKQNVWITSPSSNLIHARRFSAHFACDHQNHVQNHAKESCSSCNEGPQKEKKHQQHTKRGRFSKELPTKDSCLGTEGIRYPQKKDSPGVIRQLVEFGLSS